MGDNDVRPIGYTYIGIDGRRYTLRYHGTRGWKRLRPWHRRFWEVMLGRYQIRDHRSK